MDRRAFSTTALAFLLRPNLGAQQPATPIPRDRRTDINAIYSLILSSKCTCCEDPKQKWLIDDRTYIPDLPILESKTYTPLESAQRVADHGFHPYMNPPTDRINDAATLLADFKQQIAQPLPLDPRLRLPPHYRLITADENHHYFDLLRQGSGLVQDRAAAHAAGKRFKHEFGHFGGIDSLSPVGFNASQTLALVAYRTISGCTDERWHVLEKSSGDWRELNWPIMGHSECS